MKLREFLTVFEQSDRLRIVKNEKDVYTGFLALMAHAGNMEALMDAEVKRFRPTPEIRHKEWQKRGLMAPLQPQETPDYSFSDLQMNLYNTSYFIGERDMAEMTITVRIEDLPEFKARLARIKKIMRRRAWVNGHRTGKARKSTWKRA